MFLWLVQAFFKRKEDNTLLRCPSLVTEHYHEVCAKNFQLISYVLTVNNNSAIRKFCNISVYSNKNLKITCYAGMPYGLTFHDNILKVIYTHIYIYIYIGVCV